MHTFTQTEGRHTIKTAFGPVTASGGGGQQTASCFMARGVACFVISGLAFVSPLLCVYAYEQVRLRLSTQVGCCAQRPYVGVNVWGMDWK